MAGRGPRPKPPELRQRRNAGPQETTIPAGARATRPPTLGKAPPALKTWSASTKAWFETWRRSPQATLFSATDWQRLQMLAVIVEEFYRAPSKDLLAEIRLNEAKVGATAEDRLRLHWKIDEDAGGVEGAARAGSRGRKDPRLELIQGGG